MAIGFMPVLYAKPKSSPGEASAERPILRIAGDKALPECELYFPPGYIKGPITPPPSRHEWGEPQDGSVRPQLQLGIELEPETNLKASRLRKWGLRLTVPKSTQLHGQIQVDCGPITNREFPWRSFRYLRKPMPPT